MKDQSSTSLRALPVELVRIVFEIGASQSQETAANLARVSKTVQEWIAPLLYETVILDSPKSVSCFYETVQVAKSRFARHVTKLYLPSAPSPGVPLSFLTNFPALQHLVISSLSLRNPPHPSLLQRASPRPRTITITGRLGRISFEHSIFKSCTHLYLADDIPAPFSLTSDILPCLTHLACGYRHRSSSITAFTCLSLLLPRESGQAYANPENQFSQHSLSHPTYPVELDVLVVEMYLADGNPDLTMFLMNESLGLGKAGAPQSHMRVDPRLVLRPGIALTPERWQGHVINNVLWTSAER